jgi:hypothetical protein
VIGYLGKLAFGLTSCRELVPEIDAVGGYPPEELDLLLEVTG